MKNFDFNLIFVLIFLNLIFENYCYEIPEPKFELTYENKIIVTVPGKEDLELLIFHGSINNKLSIYEPGEFNIQMIKNEDKTWSMELENNFNESAILYYWLYAQYNEENYWLSDKKLQLNTLIKLPKVECLVTITTITGTKKQICKGQLIFEETFDTYDEKKWQREIKISGYDGEFVLYENKPQNLYIKNGNLHIVPTLTTETGEEKIFGKNIDLANRCTEDKQKEYFCRRNADFRVLPPITSAKIRTKNSFSFRYGRIDIKAKLPKGDWIFPQLFLEPLINNYSSEKNREYSAGQMRLAFIHSNEMLHTIAPRKYYQGSVLNGGIILQDFEEMFRKYHIEHLGNNFHVYSILWTDDEIILYLDDTFYGRFDNRFSHILPPEKTEDNNNTEPFHEPFYISLGVGVGGYTNFPDNTYSMNNIEKPWKNEDPKAETKFWYAYDKWIQTWNDKNHEMVVDYIKVWAV